MNARVLAEGELVTVPGIYDMPSDRYHGQPCDGPSVSSTTLRRLRLASPAHAYAEWSGNPDREPQKSSDALDFGKAAHSLLLGDERFSKEFVVSPYDDFRKKEAQEWRAAQAQAGLTVITPDNWNKIAAMSRVLAKVPEVAGGLCSGEIERSLFWKDQSGLWCKIRPDVLLLGNPIGAVDYKTTESVEPRKFERSIAQYGYHMQAALIREGIRQVLGQELEQFVFVCQEKTPPYVAVIYELFPEDLENGWYECRVALDRFAQCLGRGEWPAYQSDSWVRIGLPHWYRNQLEAERKGL